ncbi:hypothetical protein ILYODFUR_031606 [Ilyodon furcidens]|uniref:Uncharacterized protein n=1 Tax=Ilyodon furcidens TaxID=33524 RepID=A0ABV0TS40_9TELE
MTCLTVYLREPPDNSTETSSFVISTYDTHPARCEPYSIQHLVGLSGATCSLVWYFSRKAQRRNPIAVQDSEFIGILLLSFIF